MKADGTDGTNALSYLALRAMDLNRLPEPNLSVRYWAGTPRPLLVESARLIREGFGMPSMFADETVIPAMMSIGLPESIARDYASMGCVEVAIPGRWGHRATGMTYMNFGKILELVLNNGVEPVTGIQLISVNGKKDKDVDFKSYDEVWQAWKKLLNFYTGLAVESDFVCDRSLRKHDADPFGSALVDKSIERGKTLKNGGGEFDFVSQSNIGTSVIGDALAVLKKLVFEDKSVTFKELREALDVNWVKRTRSSAAWPLQSPNSAMTTISWINWSRMYMNHISICCPPTPTNATEAVQSAAVTPCLLPTSLPMCHPAWM
jgi:pyruvate-formate lyase